ncbi:MAG: 4Fe-4S binding protein [Candidatus Aminicenantes bacterium]|nr:4Fe-4S binding protein [Candidatus Aminicenantes bacterium]
MSFFKRIVFMITFFSAQLVMSEVVHKAGEEVAKKKPPTFFSFLLQPKFIVMIVIGLLVLFLLKNNKMKSGIKVTLLLISTFLFGFAGNIPADFFHSFAMHPSPMCAATKPLLYGFGIPFIVMLFVIFLLTLIGPKLFCGYVCPVGAMQELIAMLSDKLKIKRLRTNFRLAHAVRLIVFLLFIFISATAILNIVYKGQVYPKSFYDFINPFHGLEFGLEKTFIGYITHYVPFLLTIIFSFKYYRPFCHFLCPIGLYTNFIEQVSLFRIRFKKDKCTDCNICVKESPCTAIPSILESAELRPDCYTCNVCIEVCPEDALDIGIKRVK